VKKSINISPEKEKRPLLDIIEQKGNETQEALAMLRGL